MDRTPLPIPGQDKDYDSRKSRAILSNLMVEVNKDGSFKSIIKREGTLTLNQLANADDIVSNLHVGNDGLIYFAANTNLYRIGAGFTATDLGAHGFTPPFSDVVVIQNNVSPAQFLFNFNNPSGEGTIYDGSITTIIDTDFTAKDPSSGAVLNARFYFVDTTTDDEFFASSVGDGFVYDPLAFTDANEEAGKLLALKAYKSAILAFKTRSIEYWQTFDDVTFPLRRVQGASFKVGLLAEAAIDQLYEYIGWVSSDYKVYLMTGTDVEVISDIDFYNRVDPSEGLFSTAQCFFLDGINHRYFCVTFGPTVDPDFVSFTWVYDLKTRQTHYRTSPTGLGTDYAYYRSAFQSTRKLLYMSVNVGSAAALARDRLYALDPNALDDSGVDFECILQTGSVSYDTDVTIGSIEIEMETGVGNAASADPEMTVEYSKDGGVNFVTWGTVKLGGSTDKSNRIRMHNFGRLVRHTDFILRLTITEPVRVEFYGIYADIKGGF